MCAYMYVYVCNDSHTYVYMCVHTHEEIGGFAFACCFVDGISILEDV